MSLIRAALSLREASFGASRGIPTRSSGTWAGVSVTAESAMRVSTVFSCVNLLGDSMILMPARSFIGEGATRRQAPQQPAWIDEPYPGIEWSDWMHQGMTSLTLKGNHYALVTGRDGLGFPTQLLPLHPDEVAPQLRDGRVVYRVSGQRDLLPRSEVFHVSGLKWPGSVEGLSPLQYQAQTIGLTLAAAEYAARFFNEGGVPPGILKSDKKITREDAELAQALWLESHGGRSRKPAVMGSNLEYQKVSLSPNEAQFLETRKASRDEVCGFYRVPPHMISDVERSTSWGSGIEEQGLTYATFTMGPWIRRYEDALTRIVPKRQHVKFNVNALLRARTLERFQAYTLARQGGWLNIDDIRALEEKPPLPDDKGQDYLSPLNYAAIPEGGLVPDPMAEPAAPAPVTDEGE